MAGEDRVVNWMVLYLLLLKATLSSFSELASIPIVRDDFVVKRRLLTDRELNTALVVGRMTPGPNGLYIVSLGYYANGFAGAAAGWLAVITPALLVVPVLAFAGRKAHHPRIRSALNAVVLATAGISLSATLPLGADALHSALSYAIAGASLLLLIFTRVETVWVILGAAAVSSVTGLAGLFRSL